jgi:hypothetical protein
MCLLLIVFAVLIPPFTVPASPFIVQGGLVYSARIVMEQCCIMGLHLRLASYAVLGAVVLVRWRSWWLLFQGGSSRLRKPISNLFTSWKAYPSCLNPSGLPWLACQAVFSPSGPHVRSGRPTDRSAGLLVGRTHLSGMIVSLVGGNPGYRCLTSPHAMCRRSDHRRS